MISGEAPTIVHSELNISSENSFKKRERTQNWNQEEKDRLLELCRNYIQIIENKRYDARHTEAKSKVWKSIHHDFSKHFGSERTVTRLKEQWRRMKAAARSEMQEYNKRLQQSNNLPDKKKPTEFAYKVYDLLNEANRLCEQEIPFKTNLGSAVVEPEVKPIEDSTTPNAIICSDEIAQIPPSQDVTKIDSIDQNLDIGIPVNQVDETISSAPNQSVDMKDTSSKSMKITNTDEWSDFVDSDDTNIDSFANEKTTKKSCCDRLTTQMKHKEHCMRMKILQAQLVHLIRSKEILEMCKMAMENSFNNLNTCNM